jgi:undecaprenyl-diphosphatase
LFFGNLEEINIKWFEFINANNNAADFTIFIAKFCAQYLLYIVLLFLILQWVLGDNRKKTTALKATLVALISLGIGQIIIAFYPHPRPFMLGIGRKLIEHMPESSFPSDHMTLFSAIAITYMLSKRYIIGSLLLILSCLVAWARIYLGVHFPFDMIGAFILALAVSFCFIPLWKKMGKKIVALSLLLYEKVILLLLKALKKEHLLSLIVSR